MAEEKRTCLYDMHLDLGAKMVPFAGYAMPVQYAAGVLKEHLHSRSGAGLFDVSHMGQILLRDGAMQAAEALEQLVPMDLLGLAQGRQRYGLFTNAAGGIEDDLMIANRGADLFVVVNAACAERDLAHLRESIGDLCVVEPVTDRALLALQGPAAERVLAEYAPDVSKMRFMDVVIADSRFGPLWISRSGYTGDDGFEISVQETQAEPFARALLADEAVAPIGLGARDSLRLEAGLCLYGADIDATTNPLEADLTWAIQKARRAGGAREGGFPGAERILSEMAQGAARKRVGLLPEGRAPMRAGTALYESETSAEPVGHVTSGAFGPSIQRPMSMGYLPTPLSSPGTRIFGDVRGKRLPALVTAMPFRDATFQR
ncbi:MAG: glycine cleavage system aminomethyltransferase GcvT [Pseudomonadota bacterium]